MRKLQSWPSVVDVLLFSQEGEVDLHSESVDQVQIEVLRNLNNLLNSRRRGDRASENLTMVQDSLYEYGIPDFTGAGFNTQKGREQLRQEIKSAVSAFEPRLKVQDVREINPEKNVRRVLHFRIEGRLLVYPRPQRVEYDSRFDCATHRFTVDES